MAPGACGKLVATSRLSGGLYAAVYSTGTFSLSFCRPNVVPQFCDVPSLLKITLPVHFRAVLRMPATEGRTKAFSTCLPHLVVFTVFVSVGLFVYIKPPSDSSLVVDLLELQLIQAALFLLVYLAALSGNPLIIDITFFCVVSSLLEITYSEGHIANNVSRTVGGALAVISFVSIIISYMYIFWAMLRMPACESRTKDFSNCLPHLAIVITVILTAITAHLKPPSESSSMVDLLVSVFYSVVPPAMNHLI
ncbi:olfactory receptor 14A2-like [Tachyglossus aculeatus]|uniref:olfactory receptor 14A2-like n=1 Tax=Tachyglossus aculeatus TaxID=9261 RepID=UPI0018F5F258|nr:olfactory receptor 14A2-like [Tachyglossus aculeatus]